VEIEATNEDFGKGLVFAPVIGLLIGGILAGAGFLLSLVFPAYTAAALVIILYIIITGGLHLDGLGDTFDGLFSNRSRERILEIMRDSRVGTNAVLAIVSVLLLNITLLGSFDKAYFIKVLLLMPVAGRIGSLVGSGLSTYARSGEGLGKSFIDCCGIREVLIGLIPYFAIFFAVAGVPGLICGLVPPVSAFVSIKLFSKKIGGATGDILGAVCEINQTVFLAAVFILLKLAAGA
jgi:adenosylcobinamide-GDP ribazoletransferase